MKYLRIIYIILKNAYIRDSKIPGFVTTQIFQELFSITIVIIFFDAIFSNVQSLGGWNHYQVLFLYAFSKFLISLSYAFTRLGLKDFAQEMIKRGDFDFYLIRPTNPMVLVSLSRQGPIKITSSFFFLVLCIYCLINIGIPIGSSSVIWFLILLLVGFILFYLLQVITVIPAFWLIRVWTLPNIITRMSELMRYPAAIFSLPFQIILFIFFPILTVSYIPAQTLFYPPDFRYIIYMLLITAVFYFLVRGLWNLGVKNYSSASS